MGNYLNVRQQVNEEQNKANNSPRVSIEKLPSNQNALTAGEINCNEPDKDSEEIGEETIFEGYIFIE